MTTDSPVTVLKGVGEGLAQKFAILGVKTVGDLIDYFPRRYEDYSVVTPVNELRPGAVSLEAVIKQAKGRYVRRGMHVTEAVASDATGSVRLVWFNQPYRAAALKHGQRYFISGQFELKRQRFSVINPSLEMASDMPVNTARILAVYRESKGITSRQIRLAVAEAQVVMTHLGETLPASIIKTENLVSRADAVKALHMPMATDDLERARRRLGFEEVFQLTLASLLNKQENQAENALVVPFKKNLARDFVKHLPFALTADQRRTIWQIYQDIQKSQPMNRLVEGDVGSGKTVVATMSALMVLAQAWQVALMAPTELLARQHAETIHNLLRPLGRADDVMLLTGSMSGPQKTRAQAAIKSGQAKFLVGTHALIQEKVDMQRLALVVIDEQHRFGVDQRKTLMQKAGHMPHVLSLTATPIPRSLALTLYGELDISVLAEKPGGRQPIITTLVSPNSRQQMNMAITKQLDAGRQMFVVCPLISESSVLEASSAEQVYDRMRQHEFKQYRVGLLHGKLKSADKQVIMEKFFKHEFDILVSTTVIEVGVDIPNAAVMLVESAERFGLAQLHQLRGRVGRGSEQAYCFLALSDSQQPTRRLRALESSNDGFRLAELDMELRGPGAIYGSNQHGQLDLRIAKLTDTSLIAKARTAAQAVLASGENLVQYPELMDKVNRLRAVTNLN